MSYNTILVQLDIDSPIGPRLNFAIALANRFDAALVGIAAAEPYAFVPFDEGGFAAAELVKQQLEQFESRLKVLKEEFSTVAGSRPNATWRGLIGNPTRLVAENARCADLVISGKSVEPDRNMHRTVELGALVVSAGRPVFVVADNTPPIRADRVQVAWKDTREARRAIVDAMPFLKRAEEVVVTTIEEEAQARVAESLADVVNFMRHHGVKARSNVLGIGDYDVEDALSQIAKETGADLIVAGGYGHSRLREWAFGGMTRSLLKDGSVHRLLSN